MTQVLVLPPTIVREYGVARGVSIETLDRLVSGSIENNIKALVVDEIISAIDDMFDNLKQTRTEALKAYSILTSTLKSISSDESTLERMQSLYSPIVSSNFRFSLRSLASLVQIMMVFAQKAPIDEIHISKRNMTRLKKDLKRVLLSVDGMPDGTKYAGESEYDSLLSGMIVAVDFGLLMVLVFAVYEMARQQTRLSREEIEQIEVLLRDWPQEVMAQFMSMDRQDTSTPALVKLQGIIADADDRDILEEGLAPQKKGG